MSNKFKGNNLQSLLTLGTNTWVNMRPTHIKVSIACARINYLNSIILGKFTPRQLKGSYPAKSWWISETWNADHSSASSMTKPPNMCILPSKWRSRKEMLTTKSFSCKCKRMKPGSKQGMWLCSLPCKREFREIVMNSWPTESKTALRLSNATKTCSLTFWTDIKLNAREPPSS